MSDFILEDCAERRYRKQELLKLMAARSDLSGARNSCKMLLEHAPELGSDLNYPLTVAAIVCYARPFTANEPYGALPKRYLKTLEEEQRNFHKGVLEARHQYFAHSDLTNRSAYIHPANSIIAKKPIELRSPEIGSSLTDRAHNSSFFDKLRFISNVMYKNVDSDIKSLLQELYHGMELPPTKFKLRVDNGL